MIHDLLKTERTKQGLTQKQLADKAGVSFVSINRIEKGNLPRVSVINQIFKALGKDLQFVIADSSLVN
jgi:transcriptional regulator with XRE-family HTH domain